MVTPHRWIKIRQHAESWQPFKMAGDVPAGTGECRLREPKIPCLFRRSKRVQQIRWTRTAGEMTKEVKLWPYQ